MGERKRIGVIYENNENWIGGAYYILNLIAAFTKLPETEKPEIVVFCKTEQDYEQVKKSGYSYLSYRPLAYKMPGLSIVKRIINKTSSKLTGYDLFAYPLQLQTNDLRAIFPSPVGLLKSSSQKLIFWIPDFQEIYYPGFFSAQEIKNRRQSHRLIAQSGERVEFSSQQAENDFRKNFPKYRCKTAVLKFAVTHPSLPATDTIALKEKYGIAKDYYIAPNQFWKHKNQKVLIEAARLLKAGNGLNFQIVFTGKEHDYRNPDYTTGLKKIVEQEGLHDDVLFLGFIDRIDQLHLIKGAKALVQPSLFEGWSTVIEDGKAMDKFIIASDIPVHREQLAANAVFFNPLDANELAQLLLANALPTQITGDYQHNIFLYAKDFLRIAAQ
jgi:glycosyltransferase involved in cell wall biosynthesis